MKESVTMSDSINQNSKTIILPYQQAVYDRLCAVARACLCVDRKSIGSLKLRANFLLLGPTGAGKTFLAKAVASEMQVPFLTISVSDWIVLGANARGSAVTWNKIVEFIKSNLCQRGAIIFVDELDKVSHDTNWNAFLRSEIFSLCDSRTPVGLNELEDEFIDVSNVEEVESFLTYRTMIIGGAAFQNIWEERSISSLGFNPEPKSTEKPEIHSLVRWLPRELINRFCSEMFVLPMLTQMDYKLMIQTMAQGVSETWRERFLEIGMARLEQAVRDQKGARYAEEVLLAAVVEERASLANWVPEVSDKEPPSVLDKRDRSIGVI